MERKRLGFIINPMAGLGGSVGLKGSDGCVEEALRRGAIPQAEKRARTALAELLPLREELTILTGTGSLGGNVCRELGFDYILADNISCDHTSAETTKALTGWIQSQHPALVLFAGGDGTARDVYQEAQEETVFLGIPAGVKIHSPVYARNPKAAGQLAKLWLEEKLHTVSAREVLDIDEALYRSEIINTKLYGYLTIPKERHYTQNRKCGTPPSEESVMESIACRIVDEMEPDTYYLIGAGTTTRCIMRQLELPNTLIGVDLICNRQVVENDVYGEKILHHIRGKKAKLIVTITGGQGFLFGRGNQQLTPEVIRAVGKENILILATKEKLFQLRGQPLLVDTGDEELDASLSGYYRVITSYHETTVCLVSAGEPSLASS